MTLPILGRRDTNVFDERTAKRIDIAESAFRCHLLWCPMARFQQCTGSRDTCRLDPCTRRAADLGMEQAREMTGAESRVLGLAIFAV